MTQAKWFAGRRGISMLVIVIVVILTIILVTASLLLYARWIDFERMKKELEEIKKAESDALNEREPFIKKQLGPTGLGGEVDPRELSDAKPRSELDTRIKQLITGDDSEFAKTQFAAAQKARIYPTLQTLVEAAAMRMELQFNRVQNLKLELDIAKSHAESREAIKPVMPRSKEAFIAWLNQEIQKVNQDIANENNKYTELKNTLTQQRDEANQAIEAETNTFYQWQLRINNEIRELQRQLEELKVKEVIKHEIATSHGRILRPDVPNKMAFIDIGSRERVVPGLKFLVAKKGEQGRFVYKAEVEVKKCWMTYAEVSITKVFDREVPVIEGDLLVNPLFNKRRPVLVAFAGEESYRRTLKPAWSVDEATRRISEIGSKVKRAPDLDVDFVIFTEVGPQSGGGMKEQKSYDAYNKAVLLEIPIAEASEIFRFLGD